MNFGEWFEGEYRQDGEPRTRAQYRLVLESGCTLITLNKALAKKPLMPDAAVKLCNVTGGKVDPVSLVFVDRAQADAAAD